MDSALISLVERVARDAAADWGERFGFAAIESGTETREGQAVWITVKWLNPPESGNMCGRAQVGTPGGWIQLNHLSDQCGGNGQRGVVAGLVRHEIGHSLGFWHTGNTQDIMGADRLGPEHRPSPRERAHAALAYTRPPGNTDPDNDPVGHVFSVTGEAPVVVD